MTNIDAYKMRLKYLQYQSLEELLGSGELDDFNNLESVIIKTDYYQQKVLSTTSIESDLWKSLWLEAKKVEDKRLKNIQYLKNIIKENKNGTTLKTNYTSLDLNVIRDIPLKQIFDYVGLQEDQYKRGWYSCPFHREKTSSFHIMPNSNRYKCFGCGEQGSPIDFIMKYEHITTGEAIKKLKMFI